MTLLGAQLDDLVHLHGQLLRSSSEIGACRLSSTATTSNVVDAVRTAAQQALQRITADMAGLRATVDAAQAATTSSVWTGANAEAFRAAYGDFNVAMRAAEQSTAETFERFRSAIDAMSQGLADYATQLGAALDGAAASTGAMAVAVEQQRSALDLVMNSGLGLG